MKYKVGDKVIIRKWDDMKREFGVDEDGDIKTRACFVKEMREFCGKEMTIRRELGENNYNMEGTAYIFSEDEFEKKCSQKIVITAADDFTLARLYDGNEVIKTARAKCSPDDTFDFNVGAKLAFERLMNEAKWRVVHRKPKVGDYVRLVRASFSFDEVGDILKVDYVYDTGAVEVLGKNHQRDTKRPHEKWLYHLHEFEVVEPTNSVVDEKPPKHYNGKAVCIETKPHWAYTVGKVYEFKDGTTVIDNGIIVYKSKPVKSIEEWNEFHGDFAKMLAIVE